MIKIKLLVLKIIILLVFIISEMNVFSQKVSFSIYNLIPEFKDHSPIKKESTDTLVIKAEETINYPDTSASKEFVNETNYAEKMINKTGLGKQEILQYHYIIDGWKRKLHPWINFKHNLAYLRMESEV